MEPEIEGDSLGLSAILILAAQTIPGEVLVASLVVIVLLICSALVSGSEVAYFSLSPKNLTDLKNSPSSRSKDVLRLLERPRYLLATILVANNLFNIAIIILSAVIVDTLLPAEMPYWQTLLINVGLVTFVLVVFGEIMPKIYAQSANVAYARRMAQPLLGLRVVFKPLSRMLVSSTRVIERRLGRHNGSVVSLEELDQAIDITTKESATEEEVNILKGIVKFGGIGVTQVMTPRLDIHGVEESSDFDELKRVVLESGYSRLPVFKETIDTIKGILHTKDLLQFLEENSRFKWQALIRQPLFVPETKRIEDLLREFQTRGIHMAVVIDEYGGTQGIITLEDIMEEIIGEIKDEFDPTMEPFQKIDDHTYVFEGKTLINDLCKVLELKPDIFEAVMGDSDSLAGLLLELTKRIPKANEKIRYHHFTFEVMAATKKRVQSVKVHVGESEEGGA